MRKIYLTMVALLAICGANAQTLLYSNDFETNGVDDATIVGSGVVETSETAVFGHVFHNAVGGQALRSNYLLLPDNIFAKLQESGSKELSIAFWVNMGTATGYFYTPIFSAYGAAPVDGANTWPMMVAQSRLLLQVNCAGWTDFVAADNVNGVNNESTAWLDDAKWHYYTATFTEASASVYIDGVVQNKWTLTGADGHTVSGLFTNGSDLKYICLGGNQAWSWGDVDAAYIYDDLSIYSKALTVEEINATITAKSVPNSISKPLTINGKLVSEEYFSISGAKVGSDFNALGRGIYIKRATFDNGEIKSTKIAKVQ
jgi:hypothetical protein